MALPLSYNWRNLVARRLSNGLTFVVVGVVVFVLAVLLSFAAGIRASLVATGSPYNLVVLKPGATAESTSILRFEEVNRVTSTPGIATLAADLGEARAGSPLLSSELNVQTNLPRRTRDEGQTANVAVRGVDDVAFAVHPEVQLVAGRRFQQGTPEIIVGRAAQQRFGGLELGAEVELGRFGNRRFKVVGVFAAGGGAFESELWAPRTILSDVYFRAITSSVCLRMQSPDAIPAAVAYIDGPAVQLEARPRLAYSEGLAKTTRDIVVLTSILVGIMAIGAMFAVANTMYSAVDNRRREIAMLRTIGFGRGAILLSIAIESLLVCTLACIAGLAGSLALSGTRQDFISDATFTVFAYELKVTPPIIVAALLTSLVVGLVGALAPAVRAAPSTSSRRCVRAKAGYAIPRAGGPLLSRGLGTGYNRERMENGPELRDQLRSLTIPREQRPKSRPAVNTRRPRSAAVVLLLLLVLGLAGYVAWDKFGAQLPGLKPVASQPAPVRLVKVQAYPAGETAPTLTATGKIVSDHHVDVATKVSGQIVALLFEQGDRVERGQLLARIEDVLPRARRDEAAANLDKAKAEFAYQQINFDRVEGLARLGQASEIEFAEARRAHEAAQALVAASEATLAYMEKVLRDCQVEAPIGGVILERNVEVGDFVAAEGGRGAMANAQLGSIADMAKLRVEVDVNELDVGRLRPDMPCAIVPDSHKDRRYGGRIMWIDPGANYAKATVQVKVRIDEPDDVLRVEGAAQVQFLSDAPQSQAAQEPGAWVPVSAVLQVTGGRGARAFVVRDGRFSAVPVVLGRRERDFVAVVSGLTVGQEVAAEGLDRLADGQAAR